MGVEQRVTAQKPQLTLYLKHATIHGHEGKVEYVFYLKWVS